MSIDITGTLSTHLESVRKVLQPMYEESDNVASAIKNKGETQKISRYLYRIPIELYPGGTFQKYSANGGSMPVGHSLSTSHLTAGYFYSALSFRITKEEFDTTSGEPRAIINKFNLEMSRALATQSVMDDITLHTDGTGKLTASCSAASAGATSTMTFATAGDYININRLRLGLYVEVWDSTGATNRGGGVITNINRSTKVVSINANISGLTSGDILALGAMDAYGPSSLTSFASGWPTPVASQTAAGLSGDSFRHGFPYVNNATAANYYLGRQKSAITELLPAYVSAGGNSIDWSYALQLWEQIQARRDGSGVSAMSGLFGIMHMKQRRVLAQNSVTIANKDITGNKFGQILDLLPDNFQYADKVDFGGVMCLVSKRQNEDRVDFVNPSKWGRAVAEELDFWQNPNDGQRIFPRINTSTGMPMAEWNWALSCSMDWYCTDPGSSAYIDNLAVPA